MMNKIFRKKLFFLSLIVSMLFILGGCSTNDKENQSDSYNKNMTPIEQFDVASEAARPNLKELEKVFGKGTSWEMGGSTFGSDVTNEYEFRLKLQEVKPIEQATFDEIKVKVTPFTDKFLEEMKKVGIKNPVVNLRILNKNASKFKGSENLKTEYRLTLK
ncbi:hypothetical protein [Lactococcus garvieae]|uniref:hypothetical protein n=1 Tax=Lactococcus garvieae TaxID=1363 RepID=UPI0009BCB7A5|nr:hypothetical protein [Lactococcus garvieae]